MKSKQENDPKLIACACGAELLKEGFFDTFEECTMDYVS